MRQGLSNGLHTHADKLAAGADLLSMVTCAKLCMQGYSNDRHAALNVTVSSVNGSQKKSTDQEGVPGAADSWATRSGRPLDLAEV